MAPTEGRAAAAAAAQQFELRKLALENETLAKENEQVFIKAEHDKLDATNEQRALANIRYASETKAKRGAGREFEHAKFTLEIQNLIYRNKRLIKECRANIKKLKKTEGQYSRIPANSNISGKPGRNAINKPPKDQKPGIFAANATRNPKVDPPKQVAPPKKEKKKRKMFSFDDDDLEDDPEIKKALAERATANSQGKQKAELVELDKKSEPLINPKILSKGKQKAKLVELDEKSEPLPSPKILSKPDGKPPRTRTERLLFGDDTDEQITARQEALKKEADEWEAEHGIRNVVATSSKWSDRIALTKSTIGSFVKPKPALQSGITKASTTTAITTTDSSSPPSRRSSQVINTVENVPCNEICAHVWQKLNCPCGLKVYCEKDNCECENVHGPKPCREMLIGAKCNMDCKGGSHAEEWKAVGENRFTDHIPPEKRSGLLKRAF